MLECPPDAIPPGFESSPIRALHIRLIPRTPHGTTVRAHVLNAKGGTWLMCNTPPTKDPVLALALVQGLKEMARQNQWKFHLTGDLVKYGGPRRRSRPE